MGQKYGIGEQDFKTLREYGNVYIDKTHYIPMLLDQRFYFLCRPRRFGKSLLLSTLEQFFLGNKEVFKGLEIYDYNWDWVEFPVIKISFAQGAFSKSGGLSDRIDSIIKRAEDKYEVKGEGVTIPRRFESILSQINKKAGKEVVILVDEYEKPLLDSYGEEIFESNRKDLSEFYSVLKDNTEKIRFLFITGVTRFGHLNIFSGLNNLIDISLDPEYTGICGITEEELKKNLHAGVETFSVNNGLSHEEAMEELKRYYDGYHFSENLTDIYNPFSLLRCLASGRISDAWANSGSSRFILSLLKNRNFDISTIDDLYVSGKLLLGIDSDFMDPVPLLYQSGYLTIKSYNRQRRVYHLGIPNQEVREDFYESLIPYYLNASGRFSINDAFTLAEYIKDGKADRLMNWLQSFFARISYNTKFKYIEFENERDFQFVIGAIIALVSSLDNIQFEQETSQGRIDMLLRTEKYIYIFEFKLGNDASAALAQINSKNYALPWIADNREVIKIGVAFSAEQRCIVDYKIEKD